MSPLLKSPAPSVSPRLNSSRKSVGASSTITASQCLPTQIAKPRGSISLNSHSNRKSCFASTEHLAATLNRGLEIIQSQRLSPGLRRSSFRLSCMPADVKTALPIVKVDVGVQTVFDETTEKDTGESLCKKCKTEIYQKEPINDDDVQNMQLVPVEVSPSHDTCKILVPKVCQLINGY